MSLKSLAAKKIFRQISKSEDEEMDYIYHCLCCVFFSEGEDGDALLNCLLSFEFLIQEPIFEKKFVTDSRTLPFLLSILKKNKKNGDLQEKIYQVLDFICYEETFGSKIRETLKDNIQPLIFNLKDFFNISICPKVLNAFLTLILTLENEEGFAQALEKLYISDFDGKKKGFIPYITLLLQWSHDKMVEGDIEEAFLFSEVTDKLICLINICSYHSFLARLLTFNDDIVPCLAYFAVQYSCEDDEFAERVKENATEAVAALLCYLDTFSEVPEEIAEDFYVKQFVDIHFSNDN